MGLTYAATIDPSSGARHTVVTTLFWRQAVEETRARVLESLVIDTDNDHNTQETAKRVAKMYVDEVFIE